MAKQILGFGNPGVPVTGSDDGVRFDWLSGFLSAAVFYACVVALKRIDISSVDLGRDGFTTITYSACRALLAAQLLAICFALGAPIIQRSNGNRHALRAGELSFGIASFFTGASILGLIGTAVALTGLLRLPVVLATILPLAFLSPSYAVPYLRAQLREARLASWGKDSLAVSLNVWLTVCLSIVAVMSLLSKGLYPASAEADVWEHYIPYYREVLRTGSVAPGEVWIHYWASKDAGLFHLMGVVSDEFAAQLVSWVLIVMTTAIVVDLLRTTLKSTSWALFGAIVFLSGVTTDPSIGAFIRHHAAATAYTGFLIWATTKLLTPVTAHQSAVRITGFAVQFYAGLYLAQIVPLFAAFLGTLAVSAAVTKTHRHAVLPLAGLLLATISGMLAEFAISYVSTGVPSLVSARLFWLISDQKKFLDLVGSSGILYLLYTNHDNPPLSDAWFWFSRVFRLEHFLPFIAASLALLMATSVALLRRENRASGYQRPDQTILAVAGTFALVSLIPPFIFRNESTTRLYIFVNLLMPLILLPVLKASVDAYKACLTKNLLVGTFLIAGSLAVVCAGFGTYENHLLASLSYASGQLSTAKALSRTADVFSEPERFGFMQNVRKEIGSEPKIFTLTYAPGPASAFPARGLMSEPLHSLGPRHLDIIFGTPDQAAELLRRRGINYFHLSLDGPLFTGLAFSKLFKADNLQNSFKIAYQQRRQFVLTWRAPEDFSPLPAELADTLELKQKAVFVHPFGNAFFDQLRSLVSIALKNADYCKRGSEGLTYDPTCLAGTGLSKVTTDLLRTWMPSGALLPQNKQSIQNIFEETEAELTRDIPNRTSKLVGEVVSQQNFSQGAADALTDRITTELVTTVQIAIMNGCLKRYDRAFCETLTHRDERIPFGEIYQSRESVSKILGLEF